MANRCGNCGADLSHFPDPPRIPCPDCGSAIRFLDRTANEELSVREQVKTRVKRKGKSKPLIESISGDDLHRKTGTWYTKVRIIDQEKDYYLETITDPKTGEVIHHEEHKLSEHRGRGSAKKKSSP
jgi:DNA-directed RNA polymerase subunit RPC12/RpoP